MGETEWSWIYTRAGYADHEISKNGMCIGLTMTKTLDKWLGDGKTYGKFEKELNNCCDWTEGGMISVG